MSDRITIYPSLFNQTYYSFLSSQLSIDDLIQHALDYHHSAVVITDQKYLFGYMEFYHKVKAANLKPIFGLNINYQNCELILIAKNQKGYCHLIQISSRTPKQSIHPSWFNHLYVIVLQGNFFQQGVDFYYANSKESNGVYVHQTKFKTADDYQVYCALKAIAAIGNQSNVKITLKDTLVSESRYENAYLTYPCPLAKEDQQIHNLFFIIDSCEFYEPPKQKEIIKYDQTIESNDQLRSLAFCGLKKYAKDNNLPVKNNFQQYVDRLNYELKVISDLAFADYFLIVYDFVKYARHHGILVGPGRGSAASSLVAYCLGITKVDPIKYKLYFERFLNPARKSMPDIDIDFMDTKREEVVAYLLKKYTADHLAKIVTFQR